VVSETGSVLGRATREFPQYFPKPGWVEHDPNEIWASVEAAAQAAIAAAGVAPAAIAAIGLTNQRETTLLWERKHGTPLHRAIVWQDRRTSTRCQELKMAGFAEEVRAVTGLVLDPYFSATKLRWMLASIEGAERRARQGELCFGTVDSYLVYRLAGAGRCSAPHVTDVTNASRTLLLDLTRREWSPRMCEIHGVPLEVLPKLCDSAALVAHTVGFSPVPDGTPIAGIAGDQHAALFAQQCFEPGDAKCTYGTGAFVLANTGRTRCPSSHGLLETLAWQIDGVPTYALEGSCFIAGAAVQWLRDALGLIKSSSEVEALAKSVASSDGVTFVPALAGLGAPHWDAEARGVLCGLTRGTRPGHIARAVLEGIAFQVDDLLRALQADRGAALRRLRVDGGAAANDLLMQLQADLSGLPVERPTEVEATARGAALLAGIGAGIFPDPTKAGGKVPTDRRFEVGMGETTRAAEQSRWQQAVARARSSGGISESAVSDGRVSSNSVSER
jgi:glycerol kinase